MDTPDLTFPTWTTDLSRRGFGVLAASHAVPVQLWLVTPDDSILHLLARGTRVTLRAHAATDLTAMVLRSECDCEEHRTAGAGVRTVLAPGAQPLAEVVFDGAAERGWRGCEAGLLDVAAAAAIFESLLAALDAAEGAEDRAAAVA
ncbi:MAG: hypothetical protein ACXWDI_09260 [Nocardioides sp.]